MHQPWYFMPREKTARLPWVRLHGLKDYLDMPLLAARFPNLRLNFNLVPSLLEQLELCSKTGEPDREFELALKLAERLSEPEKELLINRAFVLPVETALRPHPRFFELYQKSQNRNWKNWELTDWIDLQVWTNLTWVDPEFWANPFISDLINKGGGFSEKDKKDFAVWQMVHLSKIIPTYKKLWEEGKIEVSTTPYFHPILPLLFDSEVAKISDPNFSSATSPFHFREDAKTQLELAIKSHWKRFGKKPDGVWPAEGAVSNETLDLFASSNFSWTATDEEILFASLPQSPASPEEKIAALSTGYRYSGPCGSIGIVFRNRFLSDLIGFTFRNWEAEKAVDYFLGELYRIRSILDSAGQLQRGLVTIILDGENAWEFYPKDGHFFLEELYSKLSDNPSLETVTLKEHFESAASLPVLTDIWPGSWINKNFRVWIGHPEDNRAWALLRDARQLWEKKKLSLTPEQSEEAYRHILIAEGSDWFWWYGDENFSAERPVFDLLFRENLRYVYELLDEPPPAELDFPISENTSSGTLPTGYIHPLIDGLETDFYEWSEAGCYSFSTGGAMFQKQPLEKVWYGYNQEKLFFRVDFQNGFFPQTEDSLEILFGKENLLSLAVHLDGTVIQPLDEKVPVQFYFAKVLEFSLERKWMEKYLKDRELYFNFTYRSKEPEYVFRMPSPLRMALDDQIEKSNWQV